MSGKVTFVFKRNWYSKHFSEVLMSKHRYLVCFGARGSSKTHHIILKLIAATFSVHPVNAYYCRHEFETLRKTTFKDICNFLKRYPELDECFSYSDKYNSSMIFRNNLTGNQLIPFGLDDAEKTKGISEASHVWVDEMDKCSEESIALLDAVLRSPNVEYLQFIGSFNPVSEKNWIRKRFFSEKDAYAAREDYKSILIHHSVASNNEYIDVEAYINSLMVIYANNQTLIDVNINGKWGIANNDDPWLYAFDKQAHVGDVRFMPSFPIYVFIDINNDPFEATLWQISPNMGTKDSFIHCIDEFSGKYKYDQMARMITAKYPNSIIYLGGDRSGQNQDVGRNNTVYELMAGVMGIRKKQMLLNTHNLEHKDSQVLCNVMIHNYPNFKISKNCINLIHQCEIAKIDNKKEKPGQLLKDRAEYKLDAFDSMRYMFQTLFNEFAKKTYYKILG